MTLSGAGPSVLLICDAEAGLSGLISRVREAAGDAELEVVETRIVGPAEAPAASYQRV